MKRAVAYLVAGMLLFGGISGFAQTQAAQPAQPAQSAAASTQDNRGYPKEAYVKNIPLIKVLVYRLGYKLLFWKTDMTIGELYVPLTWFRGGVMATAEITYGVTPDRPYVSIAWVDGKFDHITINAQADLMGPTWGTISATTDLSAQFNVQEPPREF